MKRGIAEVLIILILLACAAALQAQQAPAKLRLPHIFGNNMVLQSGGSSPMWGWAPAGQEVAVTFNGQTVTAKAGADGRWKVTLPKLEQSDKPAVVTVKCGSESIEIKNVLIGDVWFGSGQSNMEMGVGGTLDADKFARDADVPQIRLFHVISKWADKPQEDVEGSWVVCTPDSVRPFSAALYYFGREIHNARHLPLGLIEAAYGGTRIEPWTARPGFDAFPLLADYSFSFMRLQRSRGEYSGDALGRLDEIEKWTKESRQALADHKGAPLFPPLYGYGYPEPLHRASMLFNANVQPLVGLGLRGFLWYQGEANEFEQDTYAVKMQALVHSWRNAWGNDKLPFYYVQIANWLAADNDPAGSMGYGWPLIRMGQLMALSRIPNSGMAVTIDIGDGPDIHPKNKQDVGKRLALWALKNEYGQKDLVASGPLFKSMTIEGDKARISFDSVGTGLMVGEKNGLEPVKEVPGGTLKRFAIAGEDRKWFWADARIEGNDVVVLSPSVPKPVAVRYAFSMNPDGCNLYNKQGLPASPFRTDSWPVGSGAYR